MVEFCGDSSQQRVTVLYDDGGVEPLSLNGGAGRTDGETVWLCRLLKPSDEETIAGSLTAVARVTDVEHHVFVLCKELINDSEKREAHVWVFGRTCILCLGKTELPCLAAANRQLFKKADFVVQAVLGFKHELLAVDAHLVRSLSIDAVEVKLLHTVALLGDC